MQRRWLILTSVSIGSFMGTLDAGIVNIALPSIRSDLGLDLTSVEWVVVAYLLVLGSLLLALGRLGEVIGYRRVCVAGFAVFTAASALCAAAPGGVALVAFRVMQAVGAAALVAMGPAIVARAFPANERGRALGINAISVSLGLTLGPVLGGLLTDIATWRAIFLVNVPTGLVAIPWTLHVLPTETGARGRAFDLRGATLSGLALFALLLALSRGQDWGWASPASLGLMLAFVVLGAAFVRVERRTGEPLLDLALFRFRAFSAGLVSNIAAHVGVITATFLLPFLLQQAAGYSPVEAGLIMAPIPVTVALVAPFAGAASDRIGPRVPATLGLGFLAVGLVSLSQLPVVFTLPDLVWRLVLLGVGQGLFSSPNSSAVLGSVPPERVGTASGTLVQARTNGQALGVALAAAVVAVRMPVHVAEIAHIPCVAGTGMSLSLSIADAFVVGAAVCALGIVASVARQPTRYGGSDRTAARE